MIVDQKIHRLVLMIPILALLVQLVAWLQWGLDIPFYDDWRIFDQRDAGSFEVSNLFRPANDTIYATGKVLDSLAVLYLSYNSIAYQFLSMAVCLGLLLLFQYRLLSRTFNSASIVALAFLFSVFMLQPGSYWGLQNVAYQQAIPLLCLLASIELIVSDRWNSAVRVIVILILSLISGSAYISGAFAVATAAIVALFFSFKVDASGRRQLLQGTFAFGIAALATVPMQLWVILIHQKNHLHVPGVAFSVPWDWQFWIFLFGLFGRAVRLPFASISPAVAISIAIMLSIVLTLCALKLFFARYLRAQTLQDIRGAYIYSTLFFSVAIYLILVVAGRANLGGTPTSEWHEYFMRATARFHFFWITILIPWAVGFVANWLLKKGFANSVAHLSIGVILLIYAAFANVFSYSADFSAEANRRINGLKCLQDKIHEGEPLFCPDIFPIDLTKSVSYARTLDMSFVRTLSPAIKLLNSELVSVNNLTMDIASSGALTINNGADPQLYYKLNVSPAELSSCVSLTLQGRLTSDRENVVQLFFLSKESSGYNENQSVTTVTKAGNDIPFSITVRSSKEFQPMFRLDPGTIAGSVVKVSPIRISCH